jgi:hypothetical protein
MIIFRPTTRGLAWGKEVPSSAPRKEGLGINNSRCPRGCITFKLSRHRCVLNNFQDKQSSTNDLKAKLSRYRTDGQGSTDPLYRLYKLPSVQKLCTRR